MQGQKNMEVKIFNCKNKLPNDNDKVWFVTKSSKATHIGKWVQSENMFFIGFGEKGDFRYSFEIDYWGYLDDEDLQYVEKGVYKCYLDIPEESTQVIFKTSSNESSTFIGNYIKSNDCFINGKDKYPRNQVSMWWYSDYEKRYNINLNN